MAAMPAPPPALDDIARFLERLHGAPVTSLEPLSGGFWSSAYGYRSGADDLVVRFGDVREWFEADRDATAYAGPDLPVPEVLDIGDAFGRVYAVSRRHYGRFLEDIQVQDAPAARPAVGRLLAALRAAPPPAAPQATSWRDWLLGALADNPGGRTAGWRATLAEDPELDRLFRAVEDRVRDLVPSCPERRDLVHGDLLHRNVLVAEDASAVTAVFSWKCSLRGDFLYDVAWCTFWGESFHPGIAALDVWALTTGDPAIDAVDLADAGRRHHCYEVQIGAAHLGWHAWTGDRDALRRVADHTVAVLDRGPRG
jgi:aminoglycoside phosphotransferase (APT) family kinase protein